MSDCATTSLDAVVITDELARRPPRIPNHEAENQALSNLVSELASSPNSILQKLVETALEICHAHSAGVSLLEESDGKLIFRWPAIAGAFAPHLWGTLPRDFSPCGTVMDRNEAVLMRHPSNYFSNLRGAEPYIYEVLLIPFYLNGAMAGTIWILAHDEHRRFDAEDLRVMSSLGKFAAAAHQTVLSLNASQRVHAELQTANEQLREEVAERRLVEKKLQDADLRKDEFLATLAHELRNPLGALSNAARLLDHPRTTQEGALRARGIVRRQLDHLKRMIDDLLDVARITTGKIGLLSQPADLAATAASVAAAFRLRRTQHDIIDDLQPVWANVDVTRLEQIVANLLDNAIKFTPAGGVIRLTLREEAGMAVLRVADNGIGMSPELTERVFDLFAQGNGGLDRARGGLGIGLTLVRRLAELQSGTVEGHSNGPGKGSEFIVRFPAIAHPATARQDLQRPAAQARDVLLVEDNADIRNAMRELLELSGHRVRTAGDGLAGYEAVLASPPEIAIIDVGLPKLNGYELAQRIRETQKTGRRSFLIALTGYGLAGNRADALQAGFDAHLVKPADQATLEELINRA